MEGELGLDSDRDLSTKKKLLPLLFFGLAERYIWVL